MTDVPELQREIERIHDEGYDDFIEQFDDVIEQYITEVVEQGTFTPGVRVTADLNLTLRDRITGNRSQDMTAMLAIGMMFGAALERDIPMDSEMEAQWRDGEVSYDG
jgi:hypothetical protein